jgi:hypothetical protein
MTSPRNRKEHAAHAIELLQHAILDLAWFAATEGETSVTVLPPDARLRHTLDSIKAAEKHIRFIKGELVTFP